jgi:hypothetical protein
VRIFLIKDFFKKKIMLDEVTINEGIWKTYEYSIPDEIGTDVILLFKINRTWNPQETIGIPDPRNLGIAIGEIKFTNLEKKEFLPYGH